MDQFLSLQNQQQHEQMIAGLRQMTVALSSTSFTVYGTQTFTIGGE